MGVGGRQGVNKDGTAAPKENGEKHTTREERKPKRESARERNGPGRDWE